MTQPCHLPARLTLLLAASSLVLAACNPGGGQTTTGNGTGNTLADAAPPLAALPLAMSATTPSAPAPVGAALPPARPARLGRIPAGDRYAYLNRAYGFSQTLADAPPDYTYDYQGERPLVWQSNDGYERVAEQLPQGVRYFYYAPGASEPYFVQDPQYGYGYSDGQLTVVYGPDGQALADEAAARQAARAGQYLAWAAGLYLASQHDRHEAVAEARWQAERGAVYADQARWQAYRTQNDAWRNYADAHDPEDQGHWAVERMARAAEAARYAQSVNDAQAVARAQQAAADARATVQRQGLGGQGPHGPRPDDQGSPRPDGEYQAFGGASQPGAAPVSAGVAGAAAVGAAALVAHHQAQVNAQEAQQARAARSAQIQAQTHQAQAQAEAARQSEAARALQARGQAQEAAVQAQARQAQIHEVEAHLAQAQAAEQARQVQLHAAEQVRAQQGQAEARQSEARQVQAQQAQALQARQMQAAQAQQQAARGQAAQAQAESQARAEQQARAQQARVEQAQVRAPPVQRAAPTPVQLAAHAAPPAKPAPRPADPRDVRPQDRKPE